MFALVGCFGFVVMVSLGGMLTAEDWPQYRGGAGDGVSGEAIRTNWGESPPQALWRVPVHAGFSSFSIRGGRAFTLVRRAVDGADTEVCIALDTETGAELWATPVGAAGYRQEGSSNSGDRGGCCDGPRSTPSTDGSWVFVFSAQMILSCLDAATGALRWSKDYLPPIP